MRFYFNGCSHTMGSGLQEEIWTIEERTKTWPYLLVKDINGEVTSDNYINDANGGQSNYDIWMASTIRILHLMEVNKKPDIAIFAITNGKRFGFVPNDTEPVNWRKLDYWEPGDPHSRSVLETTSVVEIPDDYEDKPYETWVKFDRINNWRMKPLGTKKLSDKFGRRYKDKNFHRLNINTVRNFLGYHRVLPRINNHRILIEPQATDTTLNIMVSLKNFCESKNIEYYFLMMAPQLNRVIVENRVPWLNELDERTLISTSKGSKIDKLCSGAVYRYFGTPNGKEYNGGKYNISKKDGHLNAEGQIEVFKVVRDFLKND